MAYKFKMARKNNSYLSEAASDFAMELTRLSRFLADKLRIPLPLVESIMYSNIAVINAPTITIRKCPKIVSVVYYEPFPSIAYYYNKKYGSVLARKLRLVKERERFIKIESSTELVRPIQNKAMVVNILTGSLINHKRC